MKPHGTSNGPMDQAEKMVGSRPRVDGGEGVH